MSDGKTTERALHSDKHHNADTPIVTDRQETAPITEKQHQQELAGQPPKSSLFRLVFFWQTGISSLFVWQSILSLTGYMLGRYHKNAPTYYPFFYNLGGYIAFIFFDMLSRLFTMRQIFIVVPPIQVAFFVVIIIIGEVSPNAAGESNTTKFIILLAIVCFLGFINSIMQISQIRYSFRYGDKEIAAQQNGAALVGIVCVTISLILAVTLRVDQLSLNGIIFVIFQIVALVGIMFVNIKYSNTYLKPHAEPAHAEAGAVAPQKADIPEEKGPSKLATLKIILPFFFNMVLTLAILLSVFPALNISLGIGWDANPGAAIQVIILVYNITDFAGRVLGGIWLIQNARALFTFSLIRIVLVAFAAAVFYKEPYMPLIGKWYVSVIYMSLIGLTNGYTYTALFSLSARRVDKVHQGNSGYLMSLALLTGLTYGSLTILVGSETK